MRVDGILVSGIPPGTVAIALGAFEDSQGLVPTQSIYENGKAAWLTLDLSGPDGMH